MSQQFNTQMNAIKANEWTTVIGNGKRMARKWRQQRIQGELDIIDCCGREVTVYAPGFSENGMIVDDDLMRTWLPQWGSKSYYDTSFQPDGDEDFYTTRVQQQRLHDKEIAYIKTGIWQ